MLGLEHYQANQEVLHGFGQSNQQELMDLQKAIEAQHITGRDTEGSSDPSGSPLKVESLERQVRSIKYKENDLQFYRAFPKAKAYNTVEEYNLLTDYGNEEAGGFNGEGELPEEDDSVYERKSQLVKYLGTTRKVTHVMQSVSTVYGTGQQVAKETTNGILWLSKQLDIALHDADSDMKSVEFNGIYKQHEDGLGYSTNIQYLESPYVIDLRGGVLTEALMERAASELIDNHANPDTFWGANGVVSGFVKQFYGETGGERKQISNQGSANPQKVGYKISHFASQYGDMELNWDKFLRRPSAFTITNAKRRIASKAPLSPSNGSVSAVGATVANNKFTSSDAGDYFYAVIAGNRYGLSQPTLLNANSSTPVTVVQNGAVDLSFTDGGGANSAEYYWVLRAEKDLASVNNTTTKFYPLFKVSAASLANGYNGASAGTVRDLNRWLPNTQESFLTEWNSDIMALKQLAPMMKMDLAILSPAYRFMVLSYCTPILYQPTKMIRFINVGTV